MLKLVFMVISITGVLSASQVDWDEVLNKELPIGDPTIKLSKHVELIDQVCKGEKPLTPLGKAEKDDIKRFFDRLYPFVPEFPFMGQMMAELQIQKLHSWSDNEVCQILKPISHTKLMGWMEDIDKKQNDTEGIRDQFMTALSDASLPETNVTFPEFLCLIDIYIDRTVDIFKKNLPIKRLMTRLLRFHFDPFLEWFDKNIKRKAADSCELPVATEKPSIYKSIQVAVVVAWGNQVLVYAATNSPGSS